MAGRGDRLKLAHKGAGQVFSQEKRVRGFNLKRTII